ncbi:MAG: hypothetical protein NTW49_01420 [Bacteroidia bacterium]|nr:hypothetical protein [Bacteroidia bacterium]
MIIKYIFICSFVLCLWMENSQAQSFCTINAGNDTLICQPGSPVQLNAIGNTLNYTWTPSQYLSSTTIANPVAHPTTSITYHVSGMVLDTANQLIVNGDFSAGNTGFYSGYIYQTNLFPEGTYYVGSNPQTYHPNFSPCGDHTTGTGNMMIVNGAGTPNTVVWREVISVTANTSYAFSAWACNVSNVLSALAILQFSINGNLLGSPFTTLATDCDWTQFYATWNSGANTTATIAIINQNTAAGGNDFALDDISFTPFCTATDSVTITVVQAATPVVTHNNPACGDTLHLTATSNPGATYAWTGPGGFTSSLQNPEIDGVSVANTGIYSVTATVSGCVSAAGTLSVSITNAGGTNILGNDTVLCSDAVLLMDASNNGQCASCTYHWHDSYNHSGINATYLADKPGFYSVTVTNQFGCEVWDTIHVTYNDMGLDLGTDITSVCITNPVTLNATVPLGGYPSVAYHWSTGAFTPTITALSTGYYFVTVSRGSCNEKDSVHVQYDSPVSLNLTPQVLICQGAQTILDAGSFPGCSYLWSTGINTQTFVVTNPGVYIVTVTNACGSYKDTSVVSLGTIPVFSLGPDTTVCTGQVVILSAAGAGDSFIWSNGSHNPAISVVTGGIYDVTVTNQCGSSSDEAVVTVQSPLNVNLGNDTTVCPGYALACSYQGSYYWSTGATTDSIHVFTPNNYSVEITNVCGTYYGSVNLGIINTVVDLGNDTTICNGSILTLNAGNPGALYYWSTGQYVQSILVYLPGEYSVDVTNQCGTYIDSIQVSVFDTVLNLGNDTMLCHGTQITLNAGNAGSTYLWSDGATSQVLQVETAGSYSVTVTNNCGILSDNIHVGQYPVSVVNLGPDTLSINAGESATLDAGTGFIQYHWSDGSSLQTLLVSNQGWYKVTVTDVNGCLTTAGIYVEVKSSVVPVTESQVIIKLSDNSLLISSSSFPIDQVEIFDCLGNRLYSDKPGKSDVSVPSGRFADGIYLVKVLVNRKQVVKKLNLYNR